MKNTIEYLRKDMGKDRFNTHIIELCDFLNQLDNDLYYDSPIDPFYCDCGKYTHTYIHNVADKDGIISVFIEFMMPLDYYKQYQEYLFPKKFLSLDLKGSKGLEWHDPDIIENIKQNELWKIIVHPDTDLFYKLMKQSKKQNKTNKVNKIIKNSKSYDKLNLDLNKQVPNYSGIKQTNIGDTALVRSDISSHEQGVVTCVTLKGINILTLSNKYIFIKWHNVKEIVKCS